MSLTREEVAKTGREHGRRAGRVGGQKAGAVVGGAVAGAVSSGIGVPIGASAGSTAGLIIGKALGESIGEEVGERVALMVYDEMQERGIEPTKEDLIEELKKEVTADDIKQKTVRMMEEERIDEIKRRVDVDEIKRELKREGFEMIKEKPKGVLSDRGNNLIDIEEALDEAFDMGYREGIDTGKEIRSIYMDVDKRLVNREFKKYKSSFSKSEVFVNQMLPRLRELAGFQDAGSGRYRTNKARLIPDNIPQEFEYKIHERMNELIEEFWDGYYEGISDGASTYGKLF